MFPAERHNGSTRLSAEALLELFSDYFILVTMTHHSIFVSDWLCICDERIQRVDDEHLKTFDILMVLYN